MLLSLPLQAAPLQVVVSFSILADIVQQIGGEKVEVTSIIAPDEDAHGFQPRPSDARLLRQADLVIANGLGFDTWIERLARSSGHTRDIVIASVGIDALEDSGHQGHHHGDDHDHGPIDPHAWQDVANVRLYARNIAEALQQADPAGAEHYQAGLARYDASLAALDAEIRSTLSVLPLGQRKLVTSHDAFGYFGKAYGLRVIAAAGISYESEPSAAGIARLIRQLRRENVPVVFVENIADPRLIERIAREGGARIGGTLHSDALSGSGGDAETYIDMMRSNLTAIMVGLGGETASASAR
jgi:zinc/manganese transport system substrate-binding protein